MRNAILIVGLSLGVAWNAGAQTAVPPDDSSAQQTQAPVASSVAMPVQDLVPAPEAKQADDRNCLRYTGSHFATRDRKAGKCVMATGRSYSREDIERTGQLDLADAIRRLDPAVR